MSILISSMLGGIIIGANFLVHNIYNLVTGKEYHFNMWSSIIIFSVVFISGFSYALKKGQIYLLIIKPIAIIVGAAVIWVGSCLLLRKDNKTKFP